ncbi:preprotein translocase subunit SecD [Jatrophihabitans sp. GAS493]|uniref:protein translocase subunit SecD n=1 Tax=Jatrophihabitans sp. GAS493 TaxID=1907575 RepID=UPI000BBF7A7F|nr:protein translocase subunit SecD [Jatrophihabitans sp. GAS493]SOD74264.1 preprotein translocase subunit SecD [Jatrophihabitans sp. GAS493]
MAPPAGTLRVGRYFLALLAIFVVLYAIVFWPGQSRTPKLGLDLEGGTQVVFQAKTPDGSTPSKSSMEEARSIMDQRVNAYGVSEAQVVIEGSDRIVISIPGHNAADQLASIGSAAQLNFRPLIMPVVQPVAAAAAAAASASAASASAGTASGSGASTSPAASASAASTSPSANGSSSVAPKDESSRQLSPQDASARELAAAPHQASGSAAPTSAAAPASAAASTPAAAAATPTLTPAQQTLLSGTTVTENPFSVLDFPIPTTETDYEKLTSTQQQLLQATASHFDCASSPPDTKQAQTLLACDSHDKPTLVYFLGPVIVPGTEISDASAQLNSTNQWIVSLDLKSSGQAAWADYTTKHNTSGSTATPDYTSCGTSSVPCANFVAFTLDGAVVSSPYNQSAINGGSTQISGSFTQSSATNLADQLRYGALPLNFGDPLTASNVSATLGSAQLKAGLLAGGIGLALVVIYSLLYYRGLGLVTIASLVVSGGLTYGCIVFLSRQIGFTLTLAGIAGFIVAVGITADSFVVFFERIKDEVHEGRSMRVAVPRAWVRARRTILSADTVSFLAAAVLYFFAAGDVKGFAFTLGLSTILDLVVVFLFTHPLVSLLSRSATFGSAGFTGLNSARAGGVVADDSTQVKRRTKTAPPADPEPRVPTGSIRLSKPSAKAAPTAVAVAEPEANVGDELGDQDEADTAVDSDAVTPTAAAPTVSTVGSEADPLEATEPSPAPAAEPSPKVSPASGTAAERAAARRARLRAQNAGTSSDDDSKGQS